MRTYTLYVELDEAVIAQLEAVHDTPLDEVLGRVVATSVQALITSVMPPLVQDVLTQEKPVVHSAPTQPDTGGHDAHRLSRPAGH